MKLRNTIVCQKWSLMASSYAVYNLTIKSVVDQPQSTNSGLHGMWLSLKYSIDVKATDGTARLPGSKS